MTHTYTVKKNKRYRYYVCTKAQKQGWDTCPTKSLPAAEIERFIVDHIRCIGSDPGLVAETLKQARGQNDKNTKGLEKERRLLERELKNLNTELRRLVSIPAGQGGQGSLTTVRLADVHDRIQSAEQRLSVVREEIVILSKEQIDAEDLSAALSLFDPVWEALSIREQGRVMQLLVENVGYDGEQSEVAVTFRPSGIKTLAQEVEITQEEETA